MCLSTYLALVVGFYLFIMSFAMIVHGDHFKKIAKQVSSDSALMMITGTLGVIFGLIIVMSHNIWTTEWPVLITLVGWIYLLQGVARIFIPEKFNKFVKDLFTSRTYSMFCWITLIVSIYLIYAGFTQF